MKRFTICLLVLLAILFGVFAEAQAASRVVVIPIRGEITQDLASSVKREINKANTQRAQAIILDINTPGGLVDAAGEICDAIQSSKVPVIAYVNKRAWSAGALISIACPKIAISPGGSIGAAEPRPANEKTISALKADFQSWAEKNGRRADIAGGMVDKNVVVEGVKNGGEILCLTTNRALEHKFADFEAGDLQDILSHENINGAELVTAKVEYSWMDSMANMLVDPYVRTVLLAIGILGILIETITMCAFAGGIGLVALMLFFHSHVVAGLTPAWVIILFIAGIIFLALEIFVIPGHGITGIIGLITTFASIFLAIGNPGQAALSLLIALIVSGLIFALILKKLPRSEAWKKITLQTKQSSDEGYNSVENRQDLEGAVGVALTDLRPAGIALIRDERIDVTSEGGFVKKNTHVRVVKIEGMKITVKEAEGTW